MERVRAWMVEAATPPERTAIIARILGDSGSMTFIDGASTCMQGER